MKNKFCTVTLCIHISSKFRVIKQRETIQFKQHLLAYLPVDHLAEQLHTHSENFPAARRHKYRTNLYKLATAVGAAFK